MTCLVSKIDYLHVLSMFQPILICLEGEEGYCDTASFVLQRTVHTGSKDCVSPSSRFHRQQNGVEQLIQIREEEQPPDRPESAQIARDWSLKQIKSKYKTRGAFDVKKVPLHDCINQFPGQHLSVRGNTIFCTARKEVVSSKKSILTCHPILPCHCVPEHIKCDTNIVHFGTLSHRF